MEPTKGLSSILTRLGLASRLQIVAHAYKHHWVSPRIAPAGEAFDANLARARIVLRAIDVDAPTAVTAVDLPDAEPAVRAFVAGL